MAYTHDNLYFSLTTPLGPDKLLLRGFHGEERLSGLFRFVLELESEDGQVDFSQVVGKGATVTVHLADGSDRFIHGMVGRFRQAGSDPTFTRYHAELHPWLWMLTFSADCRIFQEKSVPDIVEEVFGDHGFTDFRRSLTGSYQPREYCVQYNETAFDFVSRLLEEEGIFYFFEHEAGKHTLVLGDDPSAFATTPGAATVRYGTHSQWTQQNTVVRCTLEESVIPGAFALDDFNFETPSTDLMTDLASQVAQNGSTRRVYEYPGGFLKKAEGEALTQLRAEEREAPLRTLRGDSFCRAMLPGFKTTLEDHYRSDVNAEYVVSRVSHAGTWEGYSNAFEALPAATPYRPPRTTRRPVIPGAQTAIVVGKPGEEIWTDKYGRVKVQFHWDQRGKNDEKSSCWIRVAQGWAGKSWGQWFLPRIGQEVVVSFLDGDPDRPLVTGAVYNAEQTLPYALPAEQTKSTVKSNSSKGGGGYNELRFEDKKGEEEVYFQAEKDFNRVVKNNDTLKVGFEKKDAGDQTIDVHNHRTVTIAEGNETFTVKKGNRTVAVETGNETHTVKGTRSLTVTGDETHADEANFTQTVKGNHTLRVDGDLLIDVKGKVTIKSGQNLLVDCGASLTSKAAQAVTHQAGSSLTNKAASSLTNQAGSSLTNKAGASLTNQAGASLTDKAGASATVQGSAAVTVKGAVVKIN